MFHLIYQALLSLKMKKNVTKFVICCSFDWCFRAKKIKKNLSNVLNTFENIMKNVFQRRQKAFIWTKGLRNQRLFGISNAHDEFSLIFP